jgi:hypothetical protein
MCYMSIGHLVEALMSKVRSVTKSCSITHHTHNAADALLTPRMGLVGQEWSGVGGRMQMPCGTFDVPRCMLCYMTIG